MKGTGVSSNQGPSNREAKAWNFGFMCFMYCSVDIAIAKRHIGMMPVLSTPSC